MCCVTLQGSSLGCCTVQAVGITTMMPAWRSVLHLSSALAGSAQSARCAKRAGKLERSLLFYP